MEKTQENVRDSKENSDSIAQRVSYIVENSGLSLNAFAKKCGFAESLIRKYSSGLSTPGLVYAARIAQVGNVNLNWLATGDGEPNKTAPKTTAPLDMEALEAAISLTEEAAASVGAKLTPKKKAYIASMIYEDIADTPEKRDSDVDMTNVVRLVKLAV